MTKRTIYFFTGISLASAYLTNVSNGFPGFKRPQFHLLVGTVGFIFGYYMSNFEDSVYETYRAITAVNTRAPKWVEFYPILDEAPKPAPEDYKFQPYKPYWWPIFGQSKSVDRDIDTFFKKHILPDRDPYHERRKIVEKLDEMTKSI